MADHISILWKPAGFNLPSLGARALVDVSDGDTPNIRMPIRMLSIDTPEVTAKSAKGAANLDAKFSELRAWIEDGTAPVSAEWRDYILPKLDDKAGTRHYEQGLDASAYYKKITEKRLRRSSGRRRNLFIRTADTQFDGYNRLLAYVAPSYSEKERKTMSRRDRATFNLDLVASGHAAPFVLFPSIPGEWDLPLFVEACQTAIFEKRGQYADPLQLPGYEYRMLEKLYGISKKLSQGMDLSYMERTAWRSRYCFDLSTRVLYGPEAYTAIVPQFRIWLWPKDVQTAMGVLNLVPAPQLVG